MTKGKEESKPPVQINEDRNINGISKNNNLVRCLRYFVVLLSARQIKINDESCIYRTLERKKNVIRLKK